MYDGQQLNAETSIPNGPNTIFLLEKLTLILQMLRTLIIINSFVIHKII